MSERTSNTTATSTPWYLDAGAGRAVFPGRVGSDFLRSAAPGSPRISAGSGRITRSGARRSNRRSVVSGRDLRTPKWYRTVVLTASGISGVATVVIAVAKGVGG